MITIVFRVDASIEIGTGHVMRCFTLATALKERGARCHFICREHPGNLIEWIYSRGFEVHALPLPTQGANIDGTLQHAAWLNCSQAQDAVQSSLILQNLNPDWLVADHYALDANWEAAVYQHCKHVMVIDDLADRSHNCEILLDQNLGRKLEDYDGLVPEVCERLIGPSYALLRPEFSALRKRSLDRRKSAELKRILVSLGGVDRNNATCQILDALVKAELPASTIIDIVMGATAPHVQAVKAQATGIPYNAEVSVNVTDMAERMCQADLAIGGAGSTSWERCCLGIPTIMIILADNQKMIAEGLKREGAALLQGVNDRDFDVIINLKEFLDMPGAMRQMTNCSAMVCDGKGANRTITAMSHWL